MQNILCAILMCLAGTSVHAAKRGYGQFVDLDPTNAEQTMASLADRPRMDATQWTSIVDDKRDRSYVVRPGDNLWDISKRELGNPYLWRKLWETNPFITNPHSLENGTTLSFLNVQPPADRKVATDSDWSIPLVKLSPRKKREDVDNTSILQVTVKNRAKPRFYVMDDNQFLGKVVGSYSHQRAFAQLDQVYLKFNRKKGVKVGDKFAVVSRAGKLRETYSTFAKPLGVLVRFLAEVKIVEIGEQYVKAEFLSMFNPVTRGNEIVAAQPAIDLALYKLPPGNLRAKIVMGEEAEHHFFKQGDMVVVNKGSMDGMKAGYVFRVYMNQDPFEKTKDTVDSNFKGEVQIVQVSRFASVGFVTRNTDLLKLDDHLVPAQAFVDPPSLFSRESQTVEIN